MRRSVKNDIRRAVGDECLDKKTTILMESTKWLIGTSSEASIEDCNELEL